MSARGWSGRPIRLLFSVAVLTAWTEARGQTGQLATGSVAPHETVLKVGETALTAAEFEKMVQALPPQFAAALQTIGRRGFAQQYASMLVLAQEGRRRKLDQGGPFGQMLAFDRIFLLSQLAASAIAESLGAVSQEDVSYYYSSRKEDFEQVKARGIYIPFEPSSGASGISVIPPAGLASAVNQRQRLTEAQALAKVRDLEQRIRAGESMDRVARQESQHPTASEGGDFGYVRRDQFETRVANALFALQPTRLSQPIKDSSGYYLFMVEQKRIQPLEEVRNMIENNLRQEKLSQLIGNLTKDTPIELNPKFFGAPEDNPGQGSR